MIDHENLSAHFHRVLKDIVHEALDSALDGDYAQFLAESDDYDVAEDLIEFDADLEDVEPSDIVEYVASWRALNAHRL